MRGVATLRGLLAALCLLLAWEVATPPAEVSERRAASTEPGDAAAPSAPAGAPRGAAPAFDPNALATVAATVVARPLFTPGRRPPGPSIDTAAAAAVPRDRLPRLTGVIVGPAGTRAIFAGADGKSRAATEGDVIAGFAVRTIAPGQVTLSGSEGDRVLRPTYVTAPATTPAATGAARPAAIESIRPGERGR